MSQKKKPPKRRNKSSSLGDLVGQVIDPMLRKRGFASKEILENWRAIAPHPYNEETIPDKLTWSRSTGQNAGTLFLRATPAQRLGVTHDGAAIAGAINRYFGYVLVDKIKLSASPFSPRSDEQAHSVTEPSTEARRTIDASTENIDDDELKASLRKLGYGMMAKQKK